ncbi:MAG: arginine deiminase-related protein [Kangiellaceae bacterium]|jgi:hypothetical protein
MPINQKQLTNQVVMVHPTDFGFNEQTGVDNEFQNKPQAEDHSKITQQACHEFEQSVLALESQGVGVQILNKSPQQQRVPDAVFPNNWFSTRANGELLIYPMKTANRQEEVQIDNLSKTLNSGGFGISKITDLREEFGNDQILEGTGSLIFHHPSNRLFAAISERCLAQPLKRFAEVFEYDLIAFDTLSSNSKPVYHTNVLMSCGENFAVITESVIHSKDRKRVLDSLYDTVEDVVIISEQQMAEGFCGNVLQLCDQQQQPVLVMSHSAFKGFSNPQKKILERHADFAIFNIATIESVGGGSARCMIAENFLPEVSAKKA